MKLVSKAVIEVVNSKAEAADTTTEESDAAEEEETMEVVDVEADMAEAVGITKISGRADHMQEW